MHWTYCKLPSSESSASTGISIALIEITGRRKWLRHPFNTVSSCCTVAFPSSSRFRHGLHMYALEWRIDERIVDSGILPKPDKKVIAASLLLNVLLWKGFRDRRQAMHWSVIPPLQATSQCDIRSRVHSQSGHGCQLYSTPDVSHGVRGCWQLRKAMVWECCWFHRTGQLHKESHIVSGSCQCYRLVTLCCWPCQVTWSRTVSTRGWDWNVPAQRSLRMHYYTHHIIWCMDINFITICMHFCSMIC